MAAPTELFALDVHQLAAGYRRGDFTPTDVVTALLKRIDGAGKRVDAFSVVCADAALAAAEGATEAIRQGDDRPLVGIPVAVKDMLDTAGVPTEAGSRVFEGRVPQEDAPAWAALRDAGAILLGKARTHEFAYGSATPPTKNPWSLDRTPGGSSGGSAAALAAGLAPAALGTDTGGSIRIPSGLCGTVGLKPTKDLVPTVGTIPLSWTLDHVGPMARTPQDCKTLLEAVVSGQPTAPPELPRQVKVGVIADPGPLHPAVAGAVERAAEALREVGHAVEAVEVPGFETCVDVDFTIIGAEAALYHAPWFEAKRDRYTENVEPRVAAGYGISRDEYLAARREAARFSRLFADILERVDYLLVAGMPAPAPLIGAEEIEMAGAVDQFDHALCRNTSFGNITGLPALAIPAGLHEGLPVGVQLAGPWFSDFQLLDLGQQLWEALAPPQLAPL